MERRSSQPQFSLHHTAPHRMEGFVIDADGGHVGQGAPLFDPGTPRNVVFRREPDIVLCAVERLMTVTYGASSFPAVFLADLEQPLLGALEDVSGGRQRQNVTVGGGVHR